MKPEAQRYLIMLLDEARAGPPQPDAPDDWASQHFHWFSASLATLQSVGMMSPDEAREWTNRMQVALEPVEPQRLTAFGPTKHDPPPPLARFLRLVPAPDADFDIGFGGRIQVLGIELYDTKVAVNWRIAPSPDPEAQFPDQLAAHERDTEGLPDDERHALRSGLVRSLRFPYEHLTLSDDVGTQYIGRGGGSVGGMDERVCRWEFMPGVPEKAREVVVHREDVECRVHLS
jgi:hypothetical protein